MEQRTSIPMSPRQGLVRSQRVGRDLWANGINARPKRRSNRQKHIEEQARFLNLNAVKAEVAEVAQSNIKIGNKKGKVWGELRHTTRRKNNKWIPKTEEMNFQIIDDEDTFNHEETMSMIKEWFKSYPDSEIHIGADSKKRGQTTSYVLGICLYHVGHGGTVLYHRKVVPTAGTNLERLWIELEIAMEVSNYIRGELGHEREIFVHVDYNPEPMYKVSNALYHSGMAWIKSAGFNAIAKPHAWAASSVADKLT